jgi:hypothetical protein
MLAYWEIWWQFACKLAFEKGYEGYVSFKAKSELIQHYTDTLGAIHIGGRTMIIDTAAASKLTDRYFAS